MNNNKKNKSTKKQKDNNVPSEADINNVLIAIGKKTKNPDNKSLRQFSFNPANPVFGNVDNEAVLIKILGYDNSIYKHIINMQLLYQDTYYF